MLLGFYSSHIAVLALGVANPVYRSYKSLKAADAPTAAAEEQWLPYWIVFALYSAVEFILDLAFAFWMPLYFEIKLAFVLWLQPRWAANVPAWLPFVPRHGASLLFDKFIQPFLAKHEESIDEKFEAMMNGAKNLKADDLNRLLDWASKNVSKYIGAATPPVPEVKEGKAAKEVDEKKQVEKPSSPVPEEPEVVEAEPDPTMSTGEPKKDK
jgi:hypothetical protein